jgi:hypothetical protein
MTTPTRFERPIRTTPIRHKITYTVPPPPPKPAPVIVVEDYAALFRLFEAICHPETVEGWNEADADPDSVDCDTPPVTDWQDARNSRPEPF